MSNAYNNINFLSIIFLYATNKIKDIERLSQVSYQCKYTLENYSKKLWENICQNTPYILNIINKKIHNQYEKSIKIHKNNVEWIIKCLLDAGANIDNIYSLSTPLICACHTGNIEMVKLLLKYGANIEAGGYEEYKPLHYACQQCHVEIVKILLLYGANINGKTEWNHYPIHTAAIGGNIDIVKLLLESGANKNIKDDNYKRPIDYAKEIHNCSEIINLLR